MANELSKRSFLPALDVDDRSASVTVIRTRHNFRVHCIVYAVSVKCIYTADLH